MTTLVIMTAFAGCLEPSSPGESLDLIVSYDATNGTVIETYEDGELVERKGVELTFDFSDTTSSGELIRFGVNLLDGSPATTIEADNGSVVSVEFFDHGLYEIALFALDDNAEQIISTMVVRIELRMEWTQSTTYDPLPMAVNPVPMNEGIPPAVIIIESNIENPELIENIGGGREVEVTWELIDQGNLACQQQEGHVEEGGIITWKTVHFNTYEAHELAIQYDNGQDYINVNQSVTYQYEQLETEPNS